ncbi:type II toxin-antitoxin system RelE/ParE family toxin [Trinickia fusca]|uniref:Type II toxin-antitoxin system RelE/ParE family toxin n=1 Tax=Trinickia fusca TaxID=2419777 RepID=A0A494XJ20_9BURK|nr:type II toxin-antitoxin system RelE/ParE family toxin [Trinickia fusca]RKP50727.1 type II toxin-antitoxin system RelE/ParE family toxin [Trinickia fusca]
MRPSGIVRAIYAPPTGQRLVVLHVFVKKTPRRVNETAYVRIKED